MHQNSHIDKLVNDAKAGDDQAWNILYQQYYPRLYAIALQLCSDIASAKDAVQDSFIKAFLKLPQLKDHSVFGGWIKKILMRNCYRVLHANRSQQRIERVIPTGDIWLEQELEKRLDLSLTQTRFYKAVNNLPQTLQPALLLRYFTSYNSYNQIAEILGIPVGTVRSRLNEAKSKLTLEWNQHTSDNSQSSNEGNEWNHFYYETFSGMHRNDSEKRRFFNHLDKNVEVMGPDRRLNIGGQGFEGMIIEDRKHGSWLAPNNVVSCNNISVIEVKHFNSPEHPYHCPARSVIVIRRNKSEVNRVNLHLSWQ